MALTQLLKSGASNHYSHLRACIVSQLGQRSFGMLKDKLEPQSTNWPLTTCSRVHQKSPSSTPPNLSNWCTNIRRPSSLAQLPLPPVFFKQEAVVLREMENTANCWRTIAPGFSAYVTSYQHKMPKKTKQKKQTQKTFQGQNLFSSLKRHPQI